MISFLLTTCAWRPLSIISRLERHLRAHVCTDVEGSASGPAPARQAFAMASSAW